MLGSILFAAGFVVIVGVILGVLIGVTAKVFAVEVDPRVEEVENLLPGANCGGCGFAGCSDFAKSVAEGKAAPDDCPVCSGDIIAHIGELLGLKVGGGEKKVAIVLCGGNDSVAKKGAKYNGVSDCKSASVVNNGPKVCSFGCLGLGSCSRACPFGAIEIRDGLAIVHPDICVGCGKCVETCPRDLIKMVPASAEVHVFCSSTDKGPAKKKYCSVSCIGCRKCVKAAEENQMVINGFLAQTNYEAETLPTRDLVEKAGCPTKCLKNKVDDDQDGTDKAKSSEKKDAA